jgi:glycosyltransferase involved in cell wall biosynthesis
MTLRRRAARRRRVLMLIENVPLARDHRLRKQAAALLASQFEVTVICQKDPGNKACVPGVRVLQYPAPPEGSGLLAFAGEYAYSVVMATVLTLWAFVRRGFDILQVASTPDIYFLVAAPWRWLGRPVVFDFRDPSPETYQARYGSGHGAAYRALLLLERRSLRAADRVLVVNESLRRMARQRGGVDDARIVVVGNGPVASRVARHAARPELRQGRRLLCCWVGLIGPQDRVDLALRAVDHLVHVRKRTDCAFVFVGAGEALPTVSQLALDLGLGDWVSFPGWAQEQLVFDYLSTADLGLEPNTEDYVSPVKVMEYLAAGLPVVAFAAEENVRLAGEAARYAPKGDITAMARLIDELLDDEVSRDQMGQIGQARVKEFIAWDHQAGPYVSALLELLGPAPAHRDAAPAGRKKRTRKRGVISVTGTGLADRHQ